MAQTPQESLWLAVAVVVVPAARIPELAAAAALVRLSTHQ
jgi:hypothetical protein